MSFNSIIVLIDHFTGFMQMISSHLDDFNFLDIPGTISQISEFFQTAFNSPV